MVYRHLQTSDRVSDTRLVLVATLLAFTAGHINALFLSQYAVSVSHQTGQLSHVGSAFVLGWPVVVVPLIALASFLCGAMLSGAMLGHATFEPHRRYGALAVIEGLLLLGVAALGSSHFVAALILGSVAMGLQNAFASSYHGVIIRTTHVTGILTDLGFLIGSALTGHTRQFKAVIFFLSILAGFTAGAGSGYWCASFWQFRSLFALAAVFLVLGFSYYLKKLPE